MEDLSDWDLVQHIESGVEHQHRVVESGVEHQHRVVESGVEHQHRVVEPDTPKSIYAISDLHTEFYSSAQEIFDVIVWHPASHLALAGDIGVVLNKAEIYTEFLLLCKTKYKNVVLIPGNHEYYNCKYNIRLINRQLIDICQKTGVVYIHEKNIVVDGIRFIGHTLWSLIDKNAITMINDFYQQVFKSHLDYVSAHIAGYQFIKNELAKSTESTEPVVVITHHLPSVELIHPRFTNKVMNSAFASDVLKCVDTKKVKYWFCGHTHEYASYKFKNVLVIANPYGYPGEMRQTKLSNVVYNEM
jgi:Icc-related predicted phosphoesterase